MRKERAVLQPLKEPVSIRKALLAGRVAQHTVAIGGGQAAFLVNIQLTGWNNTEEYTKGFVDGFNGAAECMQAAVLDHLSRDVRDAARYRWLRDQSITNAGVPCVVAFDHDGAEFHLSGEDANNEIDAAMAREQK